MPFSTACNTQNKNLHIFLQPNLQTNSELSGAPVSFVVNKSELSEFAQCW